MTSGTSREVLCAEFDRLAPGLFEAVGRRHGMVGRLAREGLLVMASERCRVRVRFGTGHEPDLSVTLAPPSSAALEDDEDPQQIGLGVWLEDAGDPARAWASRVLSRPEDVSAEMARAAAALGHAASVLEGDFGAWPRLRAEAARAGREWRQALDAGPEVFGRWKARQDARTAYGRGDLGKAAALYESIGDTLTAAERTRLEYARRRQ